MRVTGRVDQASLRFVCRRRRRAASASSRRHRPRHRHEHPLLRRALRLRRERQRHVRRRPHPHGSPASASWAATSRLASTTSDLRVTRHNLGVGRVRLPHRHCPRTHRRAGRRLPTRPSLPSPQSRHVPPLPPLPPVATVPPPPEPECPDVPPLPAEPALVPPVPRATHVAVGSSPLQAERETPSAMTAAIVENRKTLVMAASLDGGSARSESKPDHLYLFSIAAGSSSIARLPPDGFWRWTPPPEP